MESLPLFVRRSIAVFRSALIALVIALVPQGIWSALISLNLKTAPALPWAVLVAAVMLVLLWRFLGYGARRVLLRANRVPRRVFAWAVIAGLLGLGALTGAWILLAQFIRMPGNVLPAMGGVRRLVVVLVVLTGALISPICEEAGIFGYAQVMLRRDFSATSAIALSALIFAIAPHPPLHVPFLPKLAFFFATGITFAVSAELTDSILPGLLVHAVGLFTFFTMVWPNDPTRRLIRDGAGRRLFVYGAQVMILTVLSALAFARLAKLRDDARTRTFPATNAGSGDVAPPPAVVRRG